MQDRKPSCANLEASHLQSHKQAKNASFQTNSFSLSKKVDLSNSVKLQAENKPLNFTSINLSHQIYVQNAKKMLEKLPIELSKLREQQMEIAQKITDQAQQLVNRVHLRTYSQESSFFPLNGMYSEQTELVATPQPNVTTNLQVNSADHGTYPRNLDQIFIHQDLKKLLRARFVYPLQHPELAQKYHIKAQGGVLLFGPPGNGKSLVVKALAAELACPVLSINIAQLLSKQLGESEKQLAAIFHEARQKNPCLIFIDQIDSLATRQDAGQEIAGVKNLLSQLLTQLRRTENKAEQLMFIATSNKPWLMDTDFIRPGHFDAIHYVGLPVESTKLQILQQQLKGIDLAKDLELKSCVDETTWASAAEIVAIARQACCLAFYDAAQNQKIRPVNQQDFILANASVQRVASYELLRHYDQFAKKHGLKQNSDWSSVMENAMFSQKKDPLMQIKAPDLDVEIETLPFVSYALHHTGIHPVKRLTVKNCGKENSQNLVISLDLLPDDYANAISFNIAELGVGHEWSENNICLPLHLDRLRNVVEKEQAILQLTIRDKDEVLHVQNVALPILAYNEWLYLPEFLDLTACFVQSNHTALHSVVTAAAFYLAKLTSSNAFDGYQSKDTKRVLSMLNSLHQALLEEFNLSYINPPPSFENTGQKLRLVSETLAQKRGTCFDLAILQASLWEHIGLCPCVVLVPGHALMACWLQEPKQLDRSHVVNLCGPNDSSKHYLLKALENGELLLVNSVEVAGEQSFEQACSNAKAIVQKCIHNKENIDFIDIVASRSTMKPIP